MYFIFLRTEVLFREGGQRGQNPPFSFFCKKTRACSVYNGLTLRRRRCFTLVAHSWKFWTNVFCLRYCTEVLYVYMYSFMNVFLNPNTEEECNSFSSSCLLYCLFWRLSGDLHPIRRPLLFLYCNTVCLMICVLKEQLCVCKQAWIPSGEMRLFYLFQSPRWVLSRRVCPPPATNPLSIKLMELLYLYFDLGNICRMVTLIFAFLTLYLTFNDGLITMRPTSDSGGGDQTQNSIQRDAKELLWLKTLLSCSSMSQALHFMMFFFWQ